MPFSLNQASLIGNLGNDAETKDFKEHKKTTFSVATTHSHKDKNGEWQNKTGFQKSEEIKDEDLPRWVTEDLDNLF